MSALYVETHTLGTPESFIRGVMHGELQSKIVHTHRLINVYTQLVHQIPQTRCLFLAQTAPTASPTDLRDVFILLRWHVDEMLDIIQGGFKTLPPRYTPERYILHMVKGLQEHAAHIHHWVSTMADDDSLGIDTVVAGKSAQAIAVELLTDINEVMRFLHYARYYAQNRRTLVS